VDFQQSAVSLGRMFEYLDLATEQPPELAYAPPAPIVHRLTGAITLDGVSFGYVPDRLALDNVSLSIPAGSITAIVGPSGAGKSSLLRLLSGMERPNTGTIAFDGRSLPELSLADLRRQLSVVWQEFSVLRGTMWENLTLGLTDVPRDVVDDAIRACQLSELVTSLPLGYETPIGEWGSTLSGGQRQRLMLARALIRNAPIFLLDEATSSIDVRTEREVLNEMFARLAGRTIVFVTHRVATAALADQVFLLDEGCLAAAGTHRQLLAEHDLYQRMAGATAAFTEDPRRLRVVIGETITTRR
jgi:ABC-type multidrug transport system fused ATPase/permease subunit